MVSRSVWRSGQDVMTKAAARLSAAISTQTVRTRRRCVTKKRGRMSLTSERLRDSCCTILAVTERKDEMYTLEDYACDDGGRHTD